MNGQDTIQENSSSPMVYPLLEQDSKEAFLEGRPVILREVGRSHYKLAKIYYDKSDLVASDEHFLKALEYTELPYDFFSILKIYGFLIRSASEQLDDEKAFKYIKIAEKLIDDASTTLGSLNAEYFYNLAIIKNYGGKFVEAKENFLLAYKKSKEENEPELLAKCLLAMAILLNNLGDPTASLDYLIQLEQLLSIINKTYLKGAMYYTYSKIFLEQRDFDKAISYLSKANKELQDKKCWNLHGYVLLGYGIAYKKKGEFDKSLLYFNFALDSVDPKQFKRQYNLIQNEIDEVTDNSVDIFLDRANRRIHERTIGMIDFKHRFVLLEILFLLAKNPGQYFDKEYLARSIWKDEYNPLIHDKLIYTSVSRLRKLIEPKMIMENGKKIKNDRRKYILRGKDGYTFNPRVKIRFHMESKSHSEKSIANIEITSPV